MRHLYLLGLLYAGVLGASCTAEDKNLVLKEDFEDISNSQFFSKLEFNGETVSEGTGKDAVEGKTSLVLNTLKEKGEWPRSIRYPKGGLEGGKFYEITFDYKVLDSDRKQIMNFALIECQVNGKSERIVTETFGEKAGETGTVRVVGRVPEGAKNAYLDWTSHNGSRIAIDNIKIREFEAPKESDWMFEPDAFKAMRFKPTHPNFMDLSLPMFKMTKEQFFPFVDRYGQFKHREWKNKIHSNDDYKARIADEEKFNKKHPPLKNRDEFGGLISDDHKYEATGKFRTQKVGGKWFLVTPKGNLFWSLGIDCVGSFPSTPINGRENYFDDIADENYKSIAWWGKFDYEGKHDVFKFVRRNVAEKYGDSPDATYGKIAAKRMQAWGLNTYGAWTQNFVLNEQTVPYALIVGSVKTSNLESKEKLNAYWIPFPDYFDPKFESETMKSIAKSAAYIESPYCIGVFVDNELPWQNKDLLTARAILTCPPTQYSKIEFKNVLEKKYGSIEKLNAAWNAKYSDWNDFLKKDDFIPSTKEAEADMVAFERKIYEHYFTVCRNAVKACDPNAMYFGCRLAWTNETCAIVASEICDVVSYNLYRNDVSGYELPKGAQDKPIIIGEYHFGNQDRGVFGGGLRPRKTMEDKVESYEKYTKSAIENPVVVGAHWFQWFDQLTTGRSDGENYSIGFVDACDTPHYEMAKAARKISRKMYDMRLKAPLEQSKNTEKTTVY